MNKKKIINIYLFIIGLIFVISGTVPIIINNIEYNKINKEVKIVNNDILKESISNINLEKNITIKNIKLENNIEKYLNNIIIITNSIKKIVNSDKYKNILNINNIKNNDINSLNNYLEEISSSLNDANVKLLNNDKNNNLDYKINIDKYKKLINNNIIRIEDLKKIFNYLKENNNYEIKEEKLIFLKRNYYDEFKELLNSINSKDLNIFLFGLINDNEGPIIKANDVTIFEGNYYDLNNISCVDLVDGEIECNISGNYDKNKLGIYPIKISATDKSGITSEKVININVVEKERLKYYAEIIRNYNTVIIYELDENKEYSKIVKAFPCSTGIGGRTPTGIFYTRKGAIWGPLKGNVWGQYYTIITNNILFHSVPYYSTSKNNLKWEEYNKLGEAASAGCVRLSVADAKWIYDNCPNGMKVKIYDGELPDGVVKPAALKIDENSPYRGWDPTDPDINNPWNSSINKE